jgi:hypothetical protein
MRDAARAWPASETLHNRVDSATSQPCLLCPP